jgi:N-acetylglucosaminyldiphosphoundecaprenol N-acetyl-beta-D-mannosaminyltransferase
MLLQEDLFAGRKYAEVLGCRIDAIDWNDALERLMAWSRVGASRYICACNVHSVVTGWRDDGFKRAINDADMALPDGAPVAWVMRRLGFKSQQRLAGPDLLWKFCAHAQGSDVSVYFLGSTAETVARLEANIRTAFPQLHIAGAVSLPFRALTSSEELEIAERVHSSGAGIVFLSLGCPKQERWMAARRGMIRAPIVGVGAAFDFLAGRVKRAPRWMQRFGLEWVHRLAGDPARLWRRYLATNALFVVGLILQAVGAAQDPGAMPEEIHRES